MEHHQPKIINKFYRWLPDFKGKQRLGRLIFKKQITSIENLVVKGKYQLSYLLPNLIENIGYEIFINGIYEKETSDFIISKLPNGGVYVDIGANIGSVAFPVTRRKKNIKVVCIEASKSVYFYLEKNRQLNNLENIILINSAISDKDGELMNFYSPKIQFGKGHFSNDGNNEMEKVSTIRLDSLLNSYNFNNPDLIKVDIEGYEYYAFKGAEKILEAPEAPDVLFEFEDWAEGRAKGLKPGDAQFFLLERGFKLFILKKGKTENIISPKLKGSAMIWATKK